MSEKKAREKLRYLSNSWLYDGEIEEAKKFAADDRNTDRDCETYLSELEASVNARKNFTRWSL